MLRTVIATSLFLLASAQENTSQPPKESSVQARLNKLSNRLVASEKASGVQKLASCPADQTDMPSKWMLSGFGNKDLKKGKGTYFCKDAPEETEDPYEGTEPAGWETSGYRKGKEVGSLPQIHWKWFHEGQKKWKGKKLPAGNPHNGNYNLRCKSYCPWVKANSCEETCCEGGHGYEPLKALFDAKQEYATKKSSVASKQGATQKAIAGINALIVTLKQAQKAQANAEKEDCMNKKRSEALDEELKKRNTCQSIDSNESLEGEEKNQFNGNWYSNEDDPNEPLKNRRLSGPKGLSDDELSELPGNAADDEFDLSSVIDEEAIAAECSVTESCVPSFTSCGDDILKDF